MSTYRQPFSYSPQARSPGVATGSLPWRYSRTRASVTLSGAETVGQSLSARRSPAAYTGREPPG